MVQRIRRSPGGVVASVCWLAGLAAVIVGCGTSSGESVEPVLSPILEGQLATEHKSVFGLVIHLGRGGAICTATLIAPNLLLTARHCVAPSATEQVICGRAGLGQPYPAEDLYASNAVTMRSATSWFRGASIHVPTEGNDTCGYDVALIVLDENVPAAIATPAVPRIDREVETGEAYVAVGYGLDDNEESGNRMVRGDLHVACSPGTCGSGIRTTEFRGDTGICQGDSGGPAFDADGKVVGVVSRGAEPCSSPVYGTVTAWKNLITEVAVLAAARGRYPVPFWATSGVSDPPEPKGEVGDECSRPSDCGEGLACYQRTGEAVASCVTRCSADAVCSEGLECRSVDDGAADLCLPPVASSGEEGGCSVSGGAVLNGASGIWLAAAALLGFRCRRKRR